MDNHVVLVAFGGASPEHEVSVITAQQAIAALQEESTPVKPLYISKSSEWFTGDALLDIQNFENLKSLEERAVPCSFAFNKVGLGVLREEGKKMGFLPDVKETNIGTVLTAFHGAGGENGSFQGVCEMFNLPYTGSGVSASSIGMDKVLTKSLCKNEGLPTVPGIDFTEEEWVEAKEIILEKASSLGYPLIVKPVRLGSSIGVVRANDQQLLSNAIEASLRYDYRLLVEKVVQPLMEINCSVLGHGNNLQASVCERPVGKEELLSFADKYLSDDANKGMASADRIIPADINEGLSGKIQELSKTVFRTLGCSGLARLDFLVNSETDDVYFNEINTIPGSFSFYLWKESDISFSALLHKLIDLAQLKHQQKNRLIQTYETNLLSTKAVKGMKGLKNKNK
jgi:D-alanine-D-alanine ligase